MATLDGYIEGPNRKIDWVLIDEELHQNPVILGCGKSMFPRPEYPIHLQLMETRTFNTGVVYYRYQSVHKG